MASFFGTSYGGKKHVYTEITPTVREKIEREGKERERGKNERPLGEKQPGNSWRLRPTLF